MDQLRNNHIKNSSSFSSLRYTDLLNSQLTLSTGLTFHSIKNENDLDTYFPDVNDQYVIPIAALSENFTRSSLKGNANINLRWKKDKLTITPGLIFSNFDIKNTFSENPQIDQHYFYVLPSIEFAYGILNLSYQTDFREPALANLQPLADNTNPLFIRVGNPNLKPQFNNFINLGIRKYDTKNTLTYNASVYTTLQKNATIISRTIDGDGVQRTTPINANGTWSAGTNASFQKDWKLENNKQISLIASNNLSVNNSFVMVNLEKSNMTSLTVRPTTELRINLNDKFQFNQSYSFSNSKSTYKSTSFIDQSLTYHDSKSEIIIRPTQQIVLESTLDYRYNSNSVPGLLKDYYKWNAAVSILFLKGNRGQVKLAVNDLLDQNILASRVVRENFIEDMQGSTLRRHGLLTFTYNIRNFGGKIGGRNQLF